MSIQPSWDYYPTAPQSRSAEFSAGYSPSPSAARSFSEPHHSDASYISMMRGELEAENNYYARTPKSPKAARGLRTSSFLSGLTGRL